MKANRATKPSARKKPSDKLHEGERITSQYYLKNMVKWATVCTKAMTFREIAEMAGKSSAWWEHVIQKNWSRIKPTPTEYRAIKILHDAVIKFGGDTTGRRELAFAILSDMGSLQRDIAALMKKA